MKSRVDMAILHQPKMDHVKFDIDKQDLANIQRADLWEMAQFAKQ